MSNSAATRPTTGGTGIRSFFSKLRKPSDLQIPPAQKRCCYCCRLLVRVAQARLDVCYDGGLVAAYGTNPAYGTSVIKRSGIDWVQIGTRTYDANEIQKLIPQLEETIEKKERQIRQQQSTVETQLKRINELEKEVRTLQSECDKLRSVLDQKAQSVASMSSTQRYASWGTEELRTELQQKAVLPAVDDGVRSKKMAVSAEPANLDTQKATLQHHPKSAGLVQALAKEQVIELVECMYEMRARAGQWVIQEGEPGDRLFVVAEGQLQVSREGTVLGKLGAGVVMGNLLFCIIVTASVQALSDVQLWVLDRSVFQMITMRLGMERHAQLMAFLSKVSLFENLSEDRISKIADVLDQDYYSGGNYIIREGEKGDTFFILTSGQVRVTQQIENEPEPREIRILKQGDFFGEKALLGEEVRTASVIAINPGVEVLTLDRESFTKLIGDLEALNRDYGDSQRRATVVIPEPPSPQKTAQEKEFVDLQLRNLKRIVTLGVGGFGRVELVCISGDKMRTFALKALKKKHIVDTRQQEHIFAERNIMMETRSDWIVRLYTTFRDAKYVYMLMEVCLGGELWTTLRDRGHFDDYTARFYVACVLEALESISVLQKVSERTQNVDFCGTPEYVSPEIILNKGHDQAADYWALGIYICELMLGRPPFQAADPMKTYTLILKGVDALEIPNRRIGKTATALVKKLCKDNPGERLGCGSGGVGDIRKHRWFMGFDWEGLRSRTLKAPIVPKVASPSDVTNFDSYPPEQDVPPDEFSGWDEGF
ncbi:cGMP-dependent protein kinase [Dirofilaria immitis]|nr:cGMP-dependent protein kinase [Dirofilaria immitis]